MPFANRPVRLSSVKRDDPECDASAPVVPTDSRLRRTLVSAIQRSQQCLTAEGPQQQQQTGGGANVSPNSVCPLESPSRSVSNLHGGRSSDEFASSPPDGHLGREGSMISDITPPTSVPLMPPPLCSAKHKASGWRARMFITFEHAFHCLHRRCAENTVKPIANVLRLHKEAMDTYKDASGLKRFRPIALLKAKPDTVSTSIPTYEVPTFFHSCVLPTAALYPFALELVLNLNIGPGTLTAALVLFERFDCHRRETLGVGVTAHMMHRVIVACLVVAHKAQGDEGRRALSIIPRMAGLVRLNPLEVANLERTLLDALEWNVTVFMTDVPLFLQEQLLHI